MEGPLKPRGILDPFQQTFTDCGLLDLGFSRNKFRWWNGRDGEASVEERLDRVCATVDWIGLFPSFTVSHLDEKTSDYLPILIDSCPMNLNSMNMRRKRFKTMWAKDSRCEEVIISAWKGRGGGSTNAIRRCMDRINHCMGGL